MSYFVLYFSSCLDDIFYYRWFSLFIVNERGPLEVYLKSTTMGLKLRVETPWCVVLIFQGRRTKVDCAILFIELIKSAGLSFHQRTVIVQVELC